MSDTERLDFLEKQHVNFDYQLGGGWSTCWTSYSFLTPKHHLREAIDKAILRAVDEGRNA